MGDTSRQRPSQAGGQRERPGLGPVGTKVGEPSRTRCWGTQSWGPVLRACSHLRTQDVWTGPSHLAQPWGPVTWTVTRRQKAQGQGLGGTRCWPAPPEPGFDKSTALSATRGQRAHGCRWARGRGICPPCHERLSPAGRGLHAHRHQLGWSLHVRNQRGWTQLPACRAPGLPRSTAPQNAGHRSRDTITGQSRPRPLRSVSLTSVP